MVRFVRSARTRSFSSFSFGTFSRVSGAVALGTALLGLSAPAGAWLGSDSPCRVEEIQDTEMALFEPDKYAWELFKQLNHPANVWEQCPDEGKKLGDEGPVVWESWRNIRRGSERSTFRTRGRYPGPWRTSTPNKDQLDRIAGINNGPLIKTEADVQVVRNVPNNPSRKRPKSSKFGSKIIGADETRINRDTYLHIREQNLYDRNVINALAAKGESASLDLPPETKEVKGRWMQISEEDKPRYHWTIFKDKDGDEQLWGLTALHITTKDLPNWFWTTFEHVDIAPEFVNDSVDAYSCPDQPVGCDAVPEEIKGTKWENYRLRGTQTSFVDQRGRKVVLANSQIEDGIEERSSCMTCHAEAALETNGRPIPISDAFTGKPRENKLQRDVMQLDFMFIFKHASPSETEDQKKKKPKRVAQK